MELQDLQSKVFSMILDEITLIFQRETNQLNGVAKKQEET